LLKVVWSQDWYSDTGPLRRELYPKRLEFFAAGRAPHLTSEHKSELWGSIPPYQRDAWSKGIPQLGSGAIFPVPESEIVADPFELPPHWPRGYGLDVGWNRTAAVWGAHDRDTDVVWLWSEHYRGQAEPSVHAAAIRARGAWMQGAIDPAARGRGQKDGEQFLQNYVDLGLPLTKAENGVEAGLLDVPASVAAAAQVRNAARCPCGGGGNAARNRLLVTPRRGGAHPTMTDDDPPTVPDRLAALESAVARLRQQLDQVTVELGTNPANTRLVIQRVNVMKQIMVAQTEIDRLRGAARG